MPKPKGSAKMSVDNPMLTAGDSDESSDEEGGASNAGSSPSKMANPMLSAAAEEGDGEDEEHQSTAQMIHANASEMTDEELAELTYAFQAADMKGAGVIDADEFSTMLSVMGVEIPMEQVLAVMGEAKDGFSTWKKMADDEAVGKCRSVWEEFDRDSSGTMNLHEIGQVIAKLCELGYDPDPISSEDMADGELDFDEFSAWFLQHEGLPEFVAPGYVGGDLARTKRKGVINQGVRSALMPLKMVSKVATGPIQMIDRSVKMIRPRDGDEQGHTDRASLTREAMAKRDVLIFAEYTFMIRAGLLKPLLSGDWEDRAADMVKLREAFDCADVDGNNKLELEELQMVIRNLNPQARVAPEDIERVWKVLNPKGSDWITFEQYAKGMIQVRSNPDLSGIVPMDVPNRFQLLSLLIDSPINKDQEKLIFDRLNGLEKAGIRMLEKMKTDMDKEETEQRLSQACAGTLHDLTIEQRRSVKITHNWCMAQACFIGTFFTFWPGLFENFLVLKYETDGVAQAYWTCPETIQDPFADHNERILETSDYFIEQFPLPECEHGFCTTLPANITQYIEMNGTKALGGHWTQTVDGIESPCAFKGIPPKSVCDDYCQKLQPTWGQSTDRNHDMIMWWVLNVTGVIIGVIFELSLLMYTAVRSSVRVSWSLDLRLTPLNKERAFVANMLVRAAFEMGDPDGDVMGVESNKESRASQATADGRSKLRDFLAVAFVKGKVIITGQLFKQITQRVVNYDTATWIKPYTGTMLATAMWDTMMCHVIMRNAEIRAFGVTTSVEVFNEILDEYCPEYEKNPKSLSDTCKVQMLRAIGVAIVKHGSMFPTMEILLRHAVNYLDMKAHDAVTSSGIIDDEATLLQNFEELTLNESRAVLCIHMLCYVLDGSMSISELKLWKRLLERVEELYQIERAKFDEFGPVELRAFIIERRPKLRRAVARIPEGSKEEMEELGELATVVPRPERVTTFDNLIPRVICQKFRNMDVVPVSQYMISACFDPDANKEFMVKTLSPDEISKFTYNEFAYKATNILTLQLPS